MLQTQKYMEIVRSRGERKLPLNRVYRLIISVNLSELRVEFDRLSYF